MSVTCAIIGLGNPGQSYYHHRHNIGFRVVDQLAEGLNLTWQTGKNYEIAHALYNDRTLLLVKPLTFMNNSGEVVPYLTKKGIRPDHILVVHDELEKPFGAISERLGGSARGHNGLKSIIAACGDQFYRLRIGIGRPEHKEDVPNYVLSNFTESSALVDQVIQRAATQALAWAAQLTD